MGTNPASPIRILVDGQCALCKREGAYMRRLDGGRGRIEVVDITSPEFTPERYGITFDRAMGAIHAVLPDGRIVTGMEVFRRVYGAVGRGWLWAPTGWPGLKWVFDAWYRWFARHRLKISSFFGKRAEACERGNCRV